MATHPINTSHTGLPTRTYSNSFQLEFSLGGTSSCHGDEGRTLHAAYKFYDSEKYVRDQIDDCRLHGGNPTVTKDAAVRMEAFFNVRYLTAGYDT